ncbi:hypothetical protein BC830DRAFT_1109353 [Chytriomyces sp. MP71]|nr:hypothetical protein BC830DRAFT_1109353 [Chytriomyces sp. MP71]
MPNATGTPSRQAPSIAYIGWETEYQRQYVWRQQQQQRDLEKFLSAKKSGSEPREAPTHPQPFNRNYAMPQDFIKPRPPPPVEPPVNYVRAKDHLSLQRDPINRSVHSDPNPGGNRYGKVYANQKREDDLLFGRVEAGAVWGEDGASTIAATRGSDYGDEDENYRYHQRDGSLQRQQDRRGSYSRGANFKNDNLDNLQEGSDQQAYEQQDRERHLLSSGEEYESSEAYALSTNVKGSGLAGRNEAVFASEFDKKKGKESYERSVILDFEGQGRMKQVRPGPPSKGRTPSILAYGGGNTNPASDEQMMKSFNVKVSISEQYPHTDERNARMKAYESQRLRSPAYQNKTPKSIQDAPPQPQQPLATQQLVPKKSPFRAFVEAQSDAVKASHTFVTEYMQQYTTPRNATRVNGPRTTPFNYVFKSTKATELSPQPPLHVQGMRFPNAAEMGNKPPRSVSKTGQSQEESPDVASSIVEKNTRVNAGRGGEEDYDRYEYVAHVSSPEPMAFDDPYNTNDNDFPPERQKKYTAMNVKGRVLMYEEEPPSTWNLANDLLRRAQRQYVSHEAEH